MLCIHSSIVFDKRSKFFKTPVCISCFRAKLYGLATYHCIIGFIGRVTKISSRVFCPLRPGISIVEQIYYLGLCRPLRLLFVLYILHRTTFQEILYTVLNQNIQNSNSKLEIETRIQNSNSKIEFKNRIQKSNSKIEFKTRMQNSNSKLEFKTRIQNSNSKLEFKTRIQKSNSKIEFKIRMENSNTKLEWKTRIQNSNSKI